MILYILSEKTIQNSVELREIEEWEIYNLAYVITDLSLPGISSFFSGNSAEKTTQNSAEISEIEVWENQTPPYVIAYLTYSVISSCILPLLIIELKNCSKCCKIEWNRSVGILCTVYVIPYLSSSCTSPFFSDNSTKQTIQNSVELSEIGVWEFYILLT